MAKRYLAGLGSSYIALVINALMMIVLMPFFLRHLGEEMTGVYIMIAGLSNVLNFGIGWIAEASSVTISSRSHAHRTSYLVKPIYRLQQLAFAGYGVVICALLLLSAFVLPFFWQPSNPASLLDMQWSLALFGAHYLVFLLHNGDLSFLISQLRLDLASRFRIAHNLIFCALTVVGLLISPQIHIIFIAQLLATILVGVAGQIYLRKYHLGWMQILHTPRRRLWRAILMRVGGPIAAIAGLWGVIMYVDASLIGFLLGPAAAAHFFAGTKIADTLALLLMRISESAGPYFARLQTQDGKRQFFYLQFQRLLLFLCLIAAVGYGLFGEMVMKLWLGKDAPQLPSLLFWLSGATIPIRIMVKHEYNTLFAIQALNKVLPITCLETILRVIAMIICVHYFGLMGVPLSLILVYVFGIYWLIKHFSMRVVGVLWRDNLAQMIQPLVYVATATTIWWLFNQIFWRNGYGGNLDAALSALLLGMIGIALPVLLHKKFPLIDYKNISQAMAEMAAYKAKE